MNGRARCCALLAATMLWTSVLAGEPDAHAQPLKLGFDPWYILEAVARRLDVKLRPEIPLPAIHVASRTSLKQFQDAMEGQWGFRPHVFANGYAVARNEIFLFDAPGFYLQSNRTLEDSLAHEFVHYIQAQYWRDDLRQDGSETQAVDVQRWFREVHLPVVRDAAATHER